MKWLIDSSVYVHKTERDILFYDVRTGKHYLYVFQGEKCKIQENVISWSESNLYLGGLYRHLFANGMVNQIHPGSPVLHFPNEVGMLAGQFKQYHQRDSYRDQLNDSLLEVMISVNGLGVDLPLSNILKNNDSPDSIINCERIRSIFQSKIYRNLQKVILVGHNVGEYKELLELFAFLNRYYQVEICIPATDLVTSDKLFHTILSDKTIRVICDMKTLEYIPQEMLVDKSLIYEIYVKDLSDWEKAFDFIENKSMIQAQVIPYFDHNKVFLSQILSYSRKDIFKKKFTTLDIVRRQLINELVYGKIVIQNTGEVYTYSQQWVGNIYDNNMDQILIRAFQEEYGWNYTRNKFLNCSQCCLQYLCPPVSAIEILSQRTYCNFKAIRK